MRGPVNLAKYRRNPLTKEERKGLRVIDIRSGFFTYTTRATTTRGGYVDQRFGPRWDPRTNGPEP